MRTTTRLTIVIAAVGGGVLLGVPSALAESPPCAYPFDCPAPPGGGTTTSVGGGSTGAGAADVLPFTGGELVLLSATGAGALAAGAALVVAGRRRTAQA